MSELQDQLAERIRHRIARAAPPEQAQRPFAPDHTRASDLAQLHATHDLRETPLESDRDRFADAVTRARRQAMGLLFPLVWHQSRHNASATRLLTYAIEQLEEQGRATARLEGTVERLVHRVQRLEDRVASERRGAVGLDRHRLTDAVGPPEDVVRERLRPVAEMLQGEVVHLGCGRGELLELLGDRGHGVDRDLGMVARCREKGLDVVRADPLEHLDGRDDASLGGVVADTLVGEEPMARVVALVRLARQKLAPGGLLVLVPPGPDQLALDPDAERAYAPALLRWVVQTEGLEPVEADGAVAARRP